MLEPTETDRDRQRGAALMVVLGVALLLALLFLGALVLVGARVRAVQADWRESIGTWEEILLQYPAVSANDAALELERLTARIGIDIATRGHEGRGRPLESDRKEFRSIKRELHSWTVAQAERGDRLLDGPPSALGAWFSRHSQMLTDIREHLLRTDPPEWEMDLARESDAPIPNLLGQIDLQRVLFADGLIRLRAGDVNGADETLEASWRLSASLHDDPILITQLVLIAVARLRSAALRQLPDAPDRWIDRLDGKRHRSNFATALRMDGYVWSRFGADDLSPDRSGWAQQVGGALGSPYIAYCVADVSEGYRERVEAFTRIETRCEAEMAALDLDVPPWNRVGAMLAPNLDAAVERMTRLEYDLELTRQVMQSDHARRESSRPQALEQPSLVCPTDRWIRDVGADGGMTLRFSRPWIRPAELTGVRMPESFRP